MTNTKEKKERRSYSKRDKSEFNFFRKLFVFLVTKIGYMIRLKLVYRLKINGMENVPKGNHYIVAPNHLSTLDPPMMCGIIPRPVCFMAKQELFEIKFMRWWLDWLGAFAVNRDNLGVSTIKTAKSIKETEWVLGVFPQGTRCEPGIINRSSITKGFANLARITKCDILPVGITGTHEVKRWPFTGKVIVNIGETIPYSDDVDSVVEQWIEAVEKLTGFKYVKD